MRVADVRERLSSTISREIRRQSPLDDRRIQDWYDKRVSGEFIEGNHIQEPWIERLPMYKAFEEGLEGMKKVIEDDSEWSDFIDFLIDLRDSEGINQIFDPYSHQQEAVKNWWLGKDVVVSTGTGSGKTECFLWPILGHFWKSRIRNQSQKRGVKAIILYPMNALATDQLKRVRKIFGDDEIAEKLSARQSEEFFMNRLFQFMLYTGRTHQHGPYSTLEQDNSTKGTWADYIKQGGKIKNTMETYENLQYNDLIGAANSDGLFINLYDSGFLPRTGTPQLNPDGKKYRDYSGRITSKEMNNRLTTMTEFDTELVFRHEAHNVGYVNEKKSDGDEVISVPNHYGGTPDLLITNYSMLDYMINRPLEDGIWEDTKDWLNEHEENKLLFVLDEAHLYDGMKGLQISHLLRRLYLTLDLNHENVEKKIQFILTSASLGESGVTSEKNKFHQSLTSRRSNFSPVHFCDGDEWVPDCEENEFDKLISMDIIQNLSKKEEISPTNDEFRRNILQELNTFSNSDFSESEWFDLIRKSLFFERFYEITREPISLSELEKELFPGGPDDDCMFSQYTLDFLTSLRGPHPGTNQESPMVSVRSHILTRGLPKLHLQIASDNWKILDGPNPIINWNESNNYSMNPLVLLGCRSCGATYVRIWLRNDYLFEDGNGTRLPLRDGIDNNWVKRQRIDGGNWLNGINYETTDEITNSFGFDLHLLKQNSDNTFSIVSGKNEETDIPTSRIYNIDTVHGWLNPETCQIFPPWYVNNDQFLVPFLFPTKSDNRTDLVDYDSQSQGDGEMSDGSLFTFNHGGFCVRCRRDYHRQMKSDQIINYETRGDNIFAYLTTELMDLQKENSKIRQPNLGKKVLAFSDSVTRASNLAKELQRLSNTDQFRKILISLLHHPWYNRLHSDKFYSHKSLANLYYHFVLHSAALGKEPMEHRPDRTDSGTFSTHRAKVIAAHLLCLDDPDGIIGDKFLDDLINSIQERNSNGYSIKEKLSNFKKEMYNDPDEDVLDRVFTTWYMNEFIREDPYNMLEDWRNDENNYCSNHIRNQAKTSTPVNTVKKHEFKYVFDKVWRDLSKNPLFSNISLRPTQFVNRFIRYEISNDVIHNDEYEVLFQSIRDNNNNAEHRLFKKFIEVLKREINIDDYEIIKKQRAPHEKLQNDLKSLDALILSDVSRALIDFYVNFEDKHLPLLFYEIEKFTDPKLIRPSSSFVGSITRIISDTFLSIDQLGMGYIVLTPKAKQSIKDNLRQKFNNNPPHSVEVRCMKQIGLDFNDEASVNSFFEDFNKILDGIIQAMVRIGNSQSHASSFSLYGRNSGFTKSNMSSRMPFSPSHNTNMSRLKDILKLVNHTGNNYSTLVESCLIPDSQVFKNTSEIPGTDNPDCYTIHPQDISIKVFNSSDEKIQVCPICIRPHPHPQDILLNTCRWCRGEHLRDMDKNNPVDNQRIFRPWLEPLEKLNLGKTELPVNELRIIRAEEHTSQIGSHVREGELLSSAIKFELLFQDIPFVMPRADGGTSDPEPVIDILSSTTTMEVGIDIGDLVAVALRTIPRNASNYQQRVGRAGRKASEVCVALSWFDQSHYAQSHYNEPKKLLMHSKNPPLTYKFNQHVTKQHLCYAILGLYTKRGDFNPRTRMRSGLDPKTNLMESHGSIENFFDPLEENSFRNSFLPWIDKDLDRDKLLVILPCDLSEINSDELIRDAIINLKNNLEELESQEHNIGGQD